MRTSPAFIAVVIALISTFSANSQKIDSALNVLATQYPAEKTFIHFDKDAYVAGETIWFKAYFSSDGLPSAMSTSFFIQLVDGKGGIVANKKFPVLGAASRGNIELPDSLPQGNYYIRATTPAMINYGNEFVYRKNVFVFNPNSKTVASTSVAPSNTIVQFFPESGQLVDGILTVVAFRATDNYGNPLEASGVVRTDDGTTICSFKSYHDGIGKMQFKPVAGKKYQAEVTTGDKTNMFQLPEVMASGINLKVQDEKGGKMFLLARAAKDKTQYQQVSIIAEMNNRVVYETEIDFEDYPSVKGHLLTDSLPSGILHFTVFNSQGLPLAERLTFVNNKEFYTNASVTNEKLNPGSKAMNEFEISFPEGIQRSLSIAVTDGALYRSPNNENILSAFLLSGELKGSIHNPSYYFNVASDSVAQALDNLMLTHGWSRFTWKKVLANEFPKLKYGVTKYLSISGKVTEPNKNPVQGCKLSVFAESADSSSQQFDIPISGTGDFAVDSILYYGATKFFYVYSNNQGKPKPVVITVNQPTGPLVDGSILFEARNFQFASNPASDASLKKQFDWLKSEKDRIKVLQPVFVESKSNLKASDQTNEKYASGVFRAPGKVNLDFINQPANDKSSNALDYLKNRIQQVELVGGKFVSRKNFSLSSGQQWTVDVYVDEVPANAALLRTIRMDEIAMVKYYEAGFIGAGSGSPGGALAVYRKKDGKETPQVDKLEYFTADGYSVTREFFHPDYSKQDASTALPDNRTTLYWNPNVFTDSDTNTFKVQFYNSDNAKKFRVVVEGFDVNGKLIHLEKWIQ